MCADSTTFHDTRSQEAADISSKTRRARAASAACCEPVNLRHGAQRRGEYKREQGDRVEADRGSAHSAEDGEARDW
jgi:hypothetical protein